MFDAAALLDKAIAEIPGYYQLAFGQHRAERAESDRLAYVYRESRVHAEVDDRFARQVHTKGLFGVTPLASSGCHYVELHLPMGAPNLLLYIRLMLTNVVIAVILHVPARFPRDLL